jgi:hypothetical protein
LNKQEFKNNKMKKPSLIILLTLALSVGLNAHEKETAKTGFNFGPLPAVGYSTDLGWHYGALTDIYYYGDGSIYPNYLYKMYFEASWYSKGNSVYHASFDSPNLIPGLRLAGAISYFQNKTYSFYGFNGASALNGLYDKAIMMDGTELAKGDAGMGWYLMQRSIFRVMTGFQGKIGDNKSPWGWAGGITYYDFNVGRTVNDRVHDNLPSLFKTYVDLGIIPEDEANGGKHLDLKAGIVYDTRDHENNPKRGTNMEIYLFGAPALFEGTKPYLNLAFHFKQFYPLNERIVFGYHLAYQGNIAGDMPFYMLQTIPSINMKQINSEGLGSTCTLRGTTSNRIMADGYAWFNTEIRIPFVRFDFIKQHFQLVVNPFLDGGYVVQPYKLDEQKKWSNFRDAITAAGVNAAADGRGGDALGYAALLLQHQGTDTQLSIYDADMEKNFHLSTGFGIHVIMNQNVNISFEFAKVLFNSIANPTIADRHWLPRNDGTWGMNVGLNYIF